MVSLVFLLLQEYFQLLNLNAAIHFDIDNPEVIFHVFARFTVLAQDGTEDLINREELLFKDTLDFFTFDGDDIAAPHADNFPLAEVLEKVLRADLTVKMPVIVPVLQRDKLDWLVVHVSSEAFL